LARRTSNDESTSTRGDPLLRIAVGAALLFLVIGIGLPLVGVRSFAAADLLKRYEPYRSTTPTGFRPTNSCVSDTVDSVLPSSSEFRRRLYDGDWAERSVLESGGSPLGSVPNSATLSPLSVPLFVLPLWLAPAYVKVLEIVACVLGAYLFLRRLGLLRSSAVLGGAIFASSGFMVVWTNWPQTRTAAFIPFLFWAIERFAQERRWTAAVPIAAIVACLIFGGFPAVTGYALYAAGPYALLRCGLAQRVALRKAVGWLIGAAAAVGVGAAVTAWQLLPFASSLGGYGLSRPQTSASHLPAISLATSIFPTAFGSCGGGFSYFGPLNDIETNVFVGAAALVLVGVALVRRPPRNMPFGVRGFFVGAAAIAVVLGWFGGPLLQLAQELPVFSNNQVGRIRSVLGFFLAVLAAIGFDNLQRSREHRSRRAVVAELVAWAIGAAGLLFALHRVQLASDGRPQVSSSRYVLPIVAAIAAAGVVAVASIARVSAVRLGRLSLRSIALATIPVLVLTESLAFVLPFWPRIPVDEFYPKTPLHTFLAAHLDGDRYVSTGGTMLTGTNVFYGLATPNGHAFTNRQWRALLKTVEPAVFRTQTYSAFAAPMPLARAQSPIFDRMAVKYLVVPLRDATYGRVEPPPAANTDVTIPAGGTVDAAIPAGPLRGVSFDVADTLRPRDPLARIDVEVQDDRGRVLARSSRRTYDAIAPGPFLVPVAGEDLAPGQRARVRVHLASTDGVLHLRGSGATPGVTVVRPADDGLRLVFIDGSAVYERLHALPHIRWAAKTRVIADQRTRLMELASDSSIEDTTILDTPGPAAVGAPAQVVVTTDTGDRMRARVSAQGDGYLVVADAPLRGLRVRVDGKNRDLVTADDALVAVPVPRGEHVVTIDYDAPHARLGALVSVASGLLLLLCGAFALRRRPRAQGAHLPDRGEDVAGRSAWRS
jgi:hypothetical protein